MRRILLSCAILGLLTLPAAAASARAQDAAKPGYLVVRKAAGSGPNGPPVVTLVVHGFVLGRVTAQNEATVDIVQLPSQGGQGAPAAANPDISKIIRWHGFTGHEFGGSGFRFRAMGGYYRVVVRGSGVYLFAGGHGAVKLHGSSFDRTADGTYSVDGGPFRSLPSRTVQRQLGSG